MGAASRIAPMVESTTSFGHIIFNKRVSSTNRQALNRKALGEIREDHYIEMSLKTGLHWSEITVFQLKFRSALNIRIG